MNLNPSPDPVYYYERLDVDPEADQQKIKKAGKYAYKEFEGENQNDLLSVKKASDTLQDEKLRSRYDFACEEYGEESGTYIFEQWEKKGEPEPYKEVYQELAEVLLKETQDTTNVWSPDKFDITNPQINHHESHWTLNCDVMTSGVPETNKIHVFNLFGFDGFVDLNDGYFYQTEEPGITDNPERIHRISKEIISVGISGDMNQLILRCDIGERNEQKERFAVIDLSPDYQFGKKFSKVRNPEIVYRSQPGNASVELISGESNKLLYVRSFHSKGDIYLRFSDGAWMVNRGDPRIESANDEIARNLIMDAQLRDRQIRLLHGNKEIRIELYNPTGGKSNTSTNTGLISKSEEKLRAFANAYDDKIWGRFKSDDDESPSSIENLVIKPIKYYHNISRNVSDWFDNKSQGIRLGISVLMFILFFIPPLTIIPLFSLLLVFGRYLIPRLAGAFLILILLVAAEEPIGAIILAAPTIALLGYWGFLRYYEAKYEGTVRRKGDPLEYR